VRIELLGKLSLVVGQDEDAQHRRLARPQQPIPQPPACLGFDLKFKSAARQLALRTYHALGHVPDVTRRRQADLLAAERFQRLAGQGRDALERSLAKRRIGKVIAPHQMHKAGAQQPLAGRV
jgi:hypothetical protein